MYGFELLILIATFIIAIVALHKNSTLETRILQLKLQLGNLADEVAKLRAAPRAAPEPKKLAAKTKPPPIHRLLADWEIRRSCAKAIPIPQKETSSAATSRP